jgi:tyrosine-protein phosphatase non-receptor type 23
LNLTGTRPSARDLLYKYFGQLELVELRFPEIRVNFPWRDAFTSKQITQTSIAYEKASVIFLIAATHSSIAASQNRSDPEGLKRSYHYFRTCAGMLTYINENFLHAPSTDLSREVIKFLIGIILAQGNEVFLEKCISEKKSPVLISKLASHVAYSYTSLSEEVKEFMGKGILDRNWVTVIQAKAKYLTSVTQFQRGLVDDAAGKHGEALVRFTLAETNAKEANRIALSFASLFVNQLSPNLPADAGPSLQELTKAHLAVCTTQKNDAQKANDLIYNAVLPNPETLPLIDKTSATTPITIQEVYGNPDVQKVIGQDIFIKLVPLSVHESASVYSEEKAKLVRSEVEKVEIAEGEVKSVLDSLGVREGLSRYKSMVEGSIGREEEVPLEVRRWRDDIRVVEGREPVDRLLSQLTSLKANVQDKLDGISRDLEIESKDCEAMRVKYDSWSQEPSASLTKNIRQDLKSHLTALEAASVSDGQVVQLWGVVNNEIRLLLSEELDVVFRESAERNSSQGESLLDLDVGSEMRDDEERRQIEQLVNEIEDRLNGLHKISKERDQVLKDLKDKVSPILLLARQG